MWILVYDCGGIYNNTNILVCIYNIQNLTTKMEPKIIVKIHLYECSESYSLTLFADKCSKIYWKFNTHPGIPPDSMWFAIITSFDQTSKCHFLLPNTPHITEPLWMPMRIFKSTCVRVRRKINCYCKANTIFICSVHKKFVHAHEIQIFLLQ